MVPVDGVGDGRARRAARPRPGAAPAGGAVAQLFPRAVGWAAAGTGSARWSPGRCRYWWRDARRRANLITIAVVGVFVPVMINLGGGELRGGRAAFDATAGDSSPVLVSLSMVFVGMMASVTLANQFGFDGSAYAANVIAGVPGRIELRARMAPSRSTWCRCWTGHRGAAAVPAGRAGLDRGRRRAPVASYGAGLGVNALVSVLGAYDLPETSNPFAMNTGAGMTRSLLSIVALLASVVATVPLLLANVLLPGSGSGWPCRPGWRTGPGARCSARTSAGDLLDRRLPELLQAVTPRR